MHVFTPYVYTRVQCCGLHGDLDGKYDIQDAVMIGVMQKEAAAHGLSVPLVKDRLPACAIPKFPAHSSMWSQSPGCVNAAYVRDRGQRIMSINGPVQSACLLLILPVGGAIADACGRRPLLLLYSVLCTLGCIIYMLDAKFSHLWGDVFIILAGVSICPVSEPKDSVVLGAIVDNIGDNIAAKKSALSLLFACCQGGVLIGMIVAVVLLRLHTTNYFLPWLCYSVVGALIVVFTCLFIPETLPKDKQTGLKLHMFNPLQTHYNAFRIMFEDRILVLALVNSLMGQCLLSGLMSILFAYLMNQGFSQAGSILPGLCLNFFGIISSAFLSRYQHLFSAMNRLVFGSCLGVAGFFVIGPASVRFGHLAIFVGCCIFGIGSAFSTPAAQTIISNLAGEENQAKCQSALQSAGKVGSIIGPIIWGRFLFDATAVGLAATLPMCVCGFGQMALTLLTILMKMEENRRQRTRELPIKNSAFPLISKSNEESYGTSPTA